MTLVPTGGYQCTMAIPVFPDQNLSSFIQSFIVQLEEDFQSPTVSRFQDYMPRCRAGLQSMEEVRRDGGRVLRRTVGGFQWE